MTKTPCYVRFTVRRTGVSDDEAEVTGRGCVAGPAAELRRYIVSHKQGQERTKSQLCEPFETSKPSDKPPPQGHSSQSFPKEPPV